MRNCAAALGVILLAACSSQDDGAAAPAPTPTLTTQAVRTAADDGTQLTPGAWTIEETAGGASAAFASQGAAPQLVLVCNRAARALSFTRPGATGAGTYRIEAAGRMADVQMAPGEGGTSALVDPAQPAFASWSDPAATVRVTGEGLSLALPGHVGIGRVLESCR